MARLNAMHMSSKHCIRLGGRVVDYRLLASRSACKLSVRVGPDGVEVVCPNGRDANHVLEFLVTNAGWILNQLDRADALRTVRRVTHSAFGQILFRGEPTRIRIEAKPSGHAGNSVRAVHGEIVVSRGPRSRTAVARSLELWLRRQAREAIHTHLARITARIGSRPVHVYVMGQRTKWGNCSSRHNLSFNWRLVLAPEYVLRYLVTHEAVHLTIPDHSTKFWLSVQSLCPETERAKQWLVARAGDLVVDLNSVCPQ